MGGSERMSGADPAYRRELGDGLVLRWSTAADTAHVGFERGRLAGVEEWHDRQGMGPGETVGAGAGMAREQFLQLVFGYRSLEELRDWHADVLADDEEGRLLEALFPKRLSRALILN